MNISQIVRQVEKFAIDNSPLILTVVAVTGTVTTAVLTGKASYRACELIRKEEERFIEYDVDKAVWYDDSRGRIARLGAKQKVQLVWPHFIPPLATAALTVSAIIMSNRIGTRRAAAMAAAYSISERAFEEYRDKVVEKLGPNKEKAARDEIAQDRVHNNPPSGEVIIATGDVLCYDLYSGRYFKSDMESLKKAQNDLNYKLLNHQYASLNDFYNLLDLDNVKVGEEVGWNSDKQMEIHFSTTMSDDQKPCITIDFYVEPVRDYFRSH